MFTKLRPFNGSRNVRSMWSQTLVSGNDGEDSQQQGEDLQLQEPVSGFAQNGHSLTAWEFLQQMPQASSSWSREMYTSILTALCKHKDERITQGCKLLNEAHQRGLQLPDYTYSQFIEQLVKGKWINEAIQVLDDYKFKCGGFPTIFMCNCVVGGLCKSGRIDEALEMLRYKINHEFKCQPNVVTYNSVITALQYANRMDEVRELFVEMKQAENCAPNAITYGLYIDGLCRSGKIDQGKLVFRDMMKSGCEPDVATYNILIDSHCKAGKVVQADKFFQEMLDQGHVPNCLTYTALVDGHQRLGNLEQALAYFERMVSSGIEPKVVLVSLLLDALTTNGNLVEAVEFVEGLVGSRFSSSSLPACSSCLFLLKRLLALDKFDEVLRVLCQIGEWPNMYKPDDISIVISNSGKAEQLRHMITKRNPPSQDVPR